MIGYLVLDENFKDYLGRDWTPGKQNTASGQGNRYGNDWILAYKSPLVAAFVYPAHEGKLGKLMQVKAIGRIFDDGMRLAGTKFSSIKEVSIQEVKLVHRQRFAVLCSLPLYGEKVYSEWAANWINGDRDIAKAIEQYERLPSMSYPHSNFPIIALTSIIGPGCRLVAGGVEVLTAGPDYKPLVDSVDDLNVYAAAIGQQAAVTSGGRINLDAICKAALQEDVA